MLFWPMLFFSCVFLPPLLICEGLSFLPRFCVCLCLWEEEGRRAFFSVFARQEREMLGGTAVRNLQQSGSGSCLWMSVTLSALVDAPEDILHEWCLAVCFLLPGRQRCLIAAGLRRLLDFHLLPIWLFHWFTSLRNMSFILFVFSFELCHSYSSTRTNCGIF